MRSRLTVVLAFFVTAPLPGLVASQPPFLAGAMGGFGSFEMLLQNPDVGKELKLAPDQLPKIGEMMRSIRDRHKQEFAEFRTLDAEKRKALMKAISDQTVHELATVLKPEQLRRLKQLRCQAQGLQAFFDPVVEQVLNLTAGEKEKIKSLADDLQDDIRAALQAYQGDFRGGMKKIGELRRGAVDKAVALFTVEQRKTWKELTGPPFELKLAPQFSRDTGRPPANN
jgi:hypothetical protein